jgi:hypothetical protein
VLVPNAQIAALLTDRIARHHLAQGRDIWPTPRIRDFAGWVVERYEQQNFAAGKAPRVLEDPEEREIWRQVVSASGLADAFTDPGGAARAARQAFRALGWAARASAEGEPAIPVPRRRRCRIG